MIVTRRYATNLLQKGKNDAFEILDLKRQYSDIDGLCIGFYFDILIRSTIGVKRNAVGVTVLQAVERCLEKHGVEFR